MFNEPLKIQKIQKKANRVTKFNNVLTLLSDFLSTKESSLAKPEIYLAYTDRYWSLCVCTSDVKVFFFFFSPPFHCGTQRVVFAFTDEY